MSNEDKIYCGSGRIVTTKFGNIMKLAMHRDDLKKIAQYMNEEKSDWINLSVLEKQNKVEGKPTHYVVVDTWKPNQDAKQAPEAGGSGNELPF